MVITANNGVLSAKVRFISKGGDWASLELLNTGKALMGGLTTPNAQGWHPCDATTAVGTILDVPCTGAQITSRSTVDPSTGVVGDFRVLEFQF